jgi:hypothetical protein
MVEKMLQNVYLQYMNTGIVIFHISAVCTLELFIPNPNIYRTHCKKKYMVASRNYRK